MEKNKCAERSSRVSDTKKMKKNNNWTLRRRTVTKKASLGRRHLGSRATGSRYHFLCYHFYYIFWGIHFYFAAAVAVYLYGVAVLNFVFRFSFIFVVFFFSILLFFFYFLLSAMGSLFDPVSAAGRVLPSFTGFFSSLMRLIADFLDFSGV